MTEITSSRSLGYFPIFVKTAYYFKPKVTKVDKDVGKMSWLNGVYSLHQWLFHICHSRMNQILWFVTNATFSSRTLQWLKSRRDCWLPSFISYGCYSWCCCSFVLAPPWFWIWSHYNLTLQHSNFNTATLQNKQTYSQDCFQRMMSLFIAQLDLLGQNENSSSVKVDISQYTKK